MTLLTRRTSLLALFSILVGTWAGCSGSSQSGEAWSQNVFWKGNTHTHSLWSDGDAAPEWIADWYTKQQYNFLVLSDHNILSEGDKWFPVKEGTRLTPQRVAKLEQQFGADTVETRENGDGSTSMRLKTLAELRERFEQAGKFRFLQGEEITDGFESANIHINAFPLTEKIRPQKGGSVVETLQRNFDRVHEVSVQKGKPILAHLNHPNFTWSLTWEDFAAIRHEKFFEVYNGHNSVRNYGDAERPSTEQMWDLVNTARLRQHELPLLYGLATDDSHHYHAWGGKNTNPGRGWVMVRAANLEEDALIESMFAGDYYASTGVSLNFRQDASAIHVRIDAEPGVQYTTEFVGTRGEQVGVVLHSSMETECSYELTSDDLFVRARVRSTKAHPNPFAEGDLEMAWLQPVRGAGK
jgi:hypothetical protein